LPAAEWQHPCPLDRTMGVTSRAHWELAPVVTTLSSTATGIRPTAQLGERTEMTSLFPASAEALFTGCQTARWEQVKSPHLHQRPHCPPPHLRNRAPSIPGLARREIYARSGPITLNHGSGMTVTCGSCSGPWHDADSYCPQETAQWIADLRARLADGVATDQRVPRVATLGSDERDVPVTANGGRNVP
jgi:hypothetical protein